MEKTKLPEEKVTRLLKCQRWGVCDEGTADICEVDLKTVHRFQQGAFQRAQEHHAQVVQEVKAEGVQVDEMHSKLRGGRKDWIFSALAMGSYFILWLVFGERSQENAALLVAQVVARGRGLPVFFSDGWKGYIGALLQVVGRVYHPRRQGKVGRKPKPRLVAPPHLFYGQVVKVREKGGRVVRVVTRVVWGGGRRFFGELGKRGLGQKIQTAFQERWYGTLRGLCACLRRRNRCLSVSVERHRGRVWLLVDLYNFLLPHRSLRQGRRKCTPAMAIGLADHVWSYHDYIWHPVHPDPKGKAAMEQRVQELLKPALEVS
jgi:hypothetical protein